MKPLKILIRGLLIVSLMSSWVSYALAAPARVVAIGGALTETIYALGAEKLLVGNDTTSYYPPAANELPKVGYQRALSAEGILSLSPDLVILTDDAGPPAVLKQLSHAGVQLLKVPAGRSFADVKSTILRVADALDYRAKSTLLIERLEAQVRALESSVATQGKTKQVLFVLQHSGGAALVAGANTSADSMIHLSGADNVVSAYSGYKPLTPEALIALQPDVILVTSQGLEQTGGVEQLLKIPGLAFTPAAKSGHVIAMDALLLLGFGPRSAEAALQLNQDYQQL